MKRILVLGNEAQPHINHFLAEHPHSLRTGESPYANISGATDTVGEEIAFGLENLGTPQREMRQRVATAAERMGITELLERNPLQLSGGQTQRVVLAALSALETAPLVLEHPLQGLDAQGRQQVLNFIETYPHDVLWTCPTQAGEDELKTATEIQGQNETLQEVTTVEIPWTLKKASLHIENLTLYRPTQSRRRRKSKQKQQEILCQINLTAHAGEVWAVTGPNGAGKTTLLRTLAGLLPATNGAVTVGTRGINELNPPERVKHISLAAQHPRYQVLTTQVRSEIRAGHKGADDTYLDALLEIIRLAEASNTNPYDLSLSQQQMLATACALATQPSVLLLDEPSASLTPADTQRLEQLLLSFSGAGGTIIFTSHDTAFIKKTATHHHKLPSVIM